MELVDILDLKSRDRKGRGGSSPPTGTIQGESVYTLEQIQTVLDEEINPLVAAHSGVITAKEISDSGVVLLEMGGSCSGCAGSVVTVQHLVQSCFSSLLPEITSIETVDDPFAGGTPFYLDPFWNDGWQYINTDED